MISKQRMASSSSASSSTSSGGGGSSSSRFHHWVAPQQSEASARLLVLGAKHVGKSAAIVRFTTGRFIHQYCHSTQDWLYQHHLLQSTTTTTTNNNNNNYHEDSPPRITPTITRVELLEQKDVQLPLDFQNQNQLYQEQQQQRQNQRQSLSSRVALDKQIDLAAHERRELLRKLAWANAYVLMYSLTNAETFHRASEYLDFLANHHHQQNQCNNNNNRHPEVVAAHLSVTAPSTQQRSTTSPRRTASSRKSSKDSAGSTNHHQRPAYESASSPWRPTVPILLLGNKCDLVATGQARQVSLEEGRKLAARHRCLFFAELSILEQSAQRSIESVLLDLIASSTQQVGGPESHGDGGGRFEGFIGQPQLVRWFPVPEERKQQQQPQQPLPIQSSLVTTRLPLSKSLSAAVSTGNANMRIRGTVERAQMLAGTRRQQQQQQPVSASCKPIHNPTMLSSSTTVAQHATSARHHSAPQPLLLLLTASNQQQQQLEHDNNGAVVNAQTKSNQAAAATTTSSKQPHSTSGRYGQLKSTFKRASLAIVGGKVLASRATAAPKRIPPPPASGELAPAILTTSSLKRIPSSTPSCPTSGLESESPLHNSNAIMCNQLSGPPPPPNCGDDEIAFRCKPNSVAPPNNQATTSGRPQPLATFSNEQVVAPSRKSMTGSSRPSSWIMSRFSSSSSKQAESSSSEGRLDALQANNNEQQQQQQGSKEAAHTFKRPLFKYKERLKTVAFEPYYSSCDAVECNTSSNNNNLMQQHDGGGSARARITTSSLDGDIAYARVSVVKDGVADIAPQQAGVCERECPPSRSSSSNSHSSSSSSSNYNNSNKCNNDRSSRSSMSTTSDTYYSSLFIVCQENHQQPLSLLSSSSSSSSSAASAASHNEQDSCASSRSGGIRNNINTTPVGSERRRDSRSTLSRASTFAGSSYEEEDEAEEGVGRVGLARCKEGGQLDDGCNYTTREHMQEPVTTLTTLTTTTTANANKPPTGAATTGKQQALRTRFHVVKSEIQSTLTNLARSTARSSSPARAVKRSFCNALMSTPMGRGIAASRACETTTRAPVMNKQTPIQVAQIETIRTIPAVAGHCK